MRGPMMRLAGKLGSIGVGSVALILAVLAFRFAALSPLERSLIALDSQLQRTTTAMAADGLKKVNQAGAAVRLAPFYDYLARPQTPDEWLAKIYGIGAARGLDLAAADYRLAEPRYGIERYEITLPLNGSYAQVRAFLESALAEIPVLSVDQANFRRKGIGEARVEAEVVITLHLVAR